MLPDQTYHHSYQQLAELAHQHAQSGAAQKAVRFYRLAAEEAAAVWANEEARTHVARALELTPDAQPASRFNLLLLREEIYGRLGQVEQQEADLVSLSTLAHALNDDRLRAQVAARLGEYKLARGEFQDVISIVTLALRLAEMAGAQQEAAALHLLWGRALLRQDQYVAAESQLKRGLAIAQPAGWDRQTAGSYRYLGLLAEETGDLPRARDYYEQALLLYRQLDDKRREGDLLNNLGNVAHAQGLLGEALVYWEQAQELYQISGDRAGSCRLLINQSTACLDMGLYDQAGSYLQEGLVISRELDLAFGEALALINLALTQQYTGAYQIALESVRNALQVARQMRSLRLEGYAQSVLGKILVGLKDYAGAEDAFWEALVLWEELDQANQSYEARAGLAQVALRRENRPMARHHIQPVIEFLHSGGDLEGTESPVGVLLTCIEVLNGHDDRLAAVLLQQASEMIQRQAADIRDEEAKQSFLSQVVVNKTILEMIDGRKVENYRPV